MPFRILILLMVAASLTAACTRHSPKPSVMVSEESRMGGCVCLETLTEISDMGKVQLHPKYAYDAQERIVHRAVKMGATHLVWLYNHPPGAAARAYRCPE